MKLFILNLGLLSGEHVIDAIAKLDHRVLQTAERLSGQTVTIQEKHHGLSVQLGLTGNAQAAKHCVLTPILMLSEVVAQVGVQHVLEEHAVRVKIGNRGLSN